MKKVIILISLTGFLFLGFQNGKPRLHRSEFNRSHRIVEKLNLSEKQKDKFNSLRFESKEKEIDLHAMLKKNKINIQKLIDSDDYQKEDIFELIEKSNKIKSDITKSKVEFWINVKDILDADQKKIWDKHFQRMLMFNERLREISKRDFNRQRMGKKMGDYRRRQKIE